MDNGAQEPEPSETAAELCKYGKDATSTNLVNEDEMHDIVEAHSSENTFPPTNYYADFTSVEDDSARNLTESDHTGSTQSVAHDFGNKPEALKDHAEASTISPQISTDGAEEVQELENETRNLLEAEIKHSILNKRESSEGPVTVEDGELGPALLHEGLAGVAIDNVTSEPTKPIATGDGEEPDEVVQHEQTFLDSFKSEGSAALQPSSEEEANDNVSQPAETSVHLSEEKSLTVDPAVDSATGPEATSTDEILPERGMADEIGSTTASAEANAIVESDTGITQLPEGECDEISSTLEFGQPSSVGEPSDAEVELATVDEECLADEIHSTTESVEATPNAEDEDVESPTRHDDLSKDYTVTDESAGGPPVGDYIKVDPATARAEVINEQAMKEKIALTTDVENKHVVHEMEYPPTHEELTKEESVADETASTPRSADFILAMEDKDVRSSTDQGDVLLKEENVADETSSMSDSAQATDIEDEKSVDCASLVDEGFTKERSVTDDIALAPESAQDNNAELTIPHKGLSEDTVTDELALTAESAQTTSVMEDRDEELPTTNDQLTKQASGADEIASNTKPAEASGSMKDENMASPMLHKQLSREDTDTDEIPSTPKSAKSTVPGKDKELKPATLLQEQSTDMRMSDEIISPEDSAEATPVGESADDIISPPHPAEAISGPESKDVDGMADEIISPRNSAEATPIAEGQDVDRMADEIISPADSAEATVVAESKDVSMADEIISPADSTEATPVAESNDVDRMADEIISPPDSAETTPVVESKDVERLADEIICQPDSAEATPVVESKDVERLADEIICQPDSAEATPVVESEDMERLADEIMCQPDSAEATPVVESKDVERMADEIISPTDSAEATAAAESKGVEFPVPREGLSVEYIAEDELPSDNRSGATTAVEDDEQVDLPVPYERPSKDDTVTEKSALTPKSLEVTDMPDKDVVLAAAEEEFAKEEGVGVETHSSKESAEVNTIVKDQAPSSTEASEPLVIWADDRAPSSHTASIEDEEDLQPGTSKKWLTMDESPAGELAHSPESSIAPSVQYEESVKSAGPHEELAREDGLTDEIAFEFAKVTAAEDDEDGHPVAADEELRKEHSVADEINSKGDSIEVNPAVEDRDVETPTPYEGLAQKEALTGKLASDPAPAHMSVNASDFEDDMDVEHVTGDDQVPNKEGVTDDILLTTNSTETTPAVEGEDYESSTPKTSPAVKDEGYESSTPHEELTKEDTTTAGLGLTPESTEAIPVEDENDAGSVAAGQNVTQKESVGAEIISTHSTEATPVEYKDEELPAPKEQLAKEDTATSVPPEFPLATLVANDKHMEPVRGDSSDGEFYKKANTSDEITPTTVEDAVTDESVLTPDESASTPSTVKVTNKEPEATSEEVRADEIAPLAESAEATTLVENNYVQSSTESAGMRPVAEYTDEEPVTTSGDVSKREIVPNKVATTTESDVANPSVDDSDAKSVTAGEALSKEEDAEDDRASTNMSSDVHFEDKDVEPALAEDGNMEHMAPKEDLLKDETVVENLGSMTESAEGSAVFKDESVEPAGVEEDVSYEDIAVVMPASPVDGEDVESAQPEEQLSKEENVAGDTAQAAESEEAASEDEDVTSCQHSEELPKAAKEPQEMFLHKTGSSGTEEPQKSAPVQLTTEEESDVIARDPAEDAICHVPNGTLSKDSPVESPESTEYLEAAPGIELQSQNDSVVNGTDLTVELATESNRDAKPEVVEHEEVVAGTPEPIDKSVLEMIPGEETGAIFSKPADSHVSEEAMSIVEPGVKAGNAGKVREIPSPHEEISKDDGVVYKAPCMGESSGAKDSKPVGLEEEPSKEAKAFVEGAHAKEEHGKDGSGLHQATSAVKPTECTATTADKLSDDNLQGDDDSVDTNEQNETPAPVMVKETLPTEGDTGPASEFQVEEVDIDESEGVEPPIPRESSKSWEVSKEELAPKDVPPVQEMGEMSGTQLVQLSEKISTEEVSENARVSDSATSSAIKAEELGRDDARKVGSDEEVKDIDVLNMVERKPFFEEKECKVRELAPGSEALADRTANGVCLEKVISTSDAKEIPGTLGGFVDEYDQKQLSSQMLAGNNGSSFIDLKEVAGPDEIAEKYVVTSDSPGESPQSSPITNLDYKNADNSPGGHSQENLENKQASADTTVDSTCQSREKQEIPLQQKQVLDLDDEDLALDGGDVLEKTVETFDPATTREFGGVSPNCQEREAHLANSSHSLQVSVAPTTSSSKPLQMHDLYPGHFQDEAQISRQDLEDDASVPLSTHTTDLSSSWVTVSPIGNPEAHVLSEDSQPKFSQKSQLARPGDELAAGRNDWRMVSGQDVSALVGSNRPTKSKQQDLDTGSSGTKFPFSIVLWCSQSMASLFGSSQRQS